MQVKALKTFNGRMGLIRTGVVITVDDRYGKQLIGNKLATLHKPGVNAPKSNADLGDAPSNTDLGGPSKRKEADLGNEEGGDQGGSSGDETGEGTDQTRSQRGQESGSTADSSEDQPAGGRGRQSSSQRLAPPSRKKTSTTSKARRS